MRDRFVLRYRGDGGSPDADVEEIRGLPNAAVVDRSSKMLLVESEEEPLRRLVESLPGWVMVPERTVPLPDTRKRVRQPPAD